MRDKSKYYLTPQEFFAETIASMQAGKVSDKLARMFFKLCEKHANHPYFVRYHHIRDDLISASILGCVKGFNNFRPYKNTLIRDDNDEILSSTKVAWNGEDVEYDYRTCNNPFAYFTSCASNEILQFLKSEYKQRNVVNRVKLESGLDADEGYLDMIREKENEAKRIAAEEELDLEEDEEDVSEAGGMIEWENS